jgi:hypothetical protein
MDKETGAPDSMNLQFPPTFQAVPEEMISWRESYVNTEQNQLQPRIHEQVDLASLPQTLLVVTNNNCLSGGASAGAAFQNYDYSAANHCIEPTAFTTRNVAVLPPFQSLPVQSEEDRYKTMWSPEEAKRLFAQHFQSLNEFSSSMRPPQTAAAPTVASWRRPASLNPAVSSSNTQQRSSRICAPVPRWPQVNSTGQQHSSTLESSPDEAALQMSLHTSLGSQPDMSSMLPGERFAQSEYTSAGKRGEVLHTADHLNHGSMMNSMQHASGHAGALLQLPYDSFLTMDRGDRHQILTASTTDQLHQQAASARLAAAHQDLQLQLAIGYSNDRPAVQLDHHGTQNSLQWSQTFPSTSAAAAACPRKRNAPDDPLLVDHRASSKLKQPWQDPQFSNKATIPAAAPPATSSQLFSHSYPAPANTTTFAGPPGKSSMNFRPSWRPVEQAAGAAAATTPTKLHTIPEDQVPCNHGWNSELQYKRPAGCQEPLTIDEWLRKSATSSTTPSPGAASLPSSSLQFPAAYPGIIPSPAKRSWNDIPWQQQQQQQDQLPVIPQEQWWVPKATNCTASAATRASTSHEQLSAFPESWNPSAANNSYNYNTMMTAEELAGAAATTTATKDLAAWRSCTAPAADISLYNDQSSEQQPIKFMDLLCMDSETDDISTSCEASQYSDDPNAQIQYNCDHDAMSFMSTIRPAAANHDAMSFMGAIQPAAAAAAATSDHHLLEAAAPGSSAAPAVLTSPENTNIVTGHFSRGVWKKDSPLQMSSKVGVDHIHEFLQLYY